MCFIVMDVRCLLVSGVFGIYLLLIIFYLALPFSHAGRVTLCQQPQRVTRKGRHISYAPKKQGFPLIQRYYHAAPELAHVEKHVRSDSCRRKLMITALDKWLPKVDFRSRSKTLRTFN